MLLCAVICRPGSSLSARSLVHNGEDRRENRTEANRRDILPAPRERMISCCVYVPFGRDCANGAT